MENGIEAQLNTPENGNADAPDLAQHVILEFIAGHVVDRVENMLGLVAICL